MKKTIDTPARNRYTDEDGIDRRGFLECMRWAGAGLIWTIRSGVPASSMLAADMKHPMKSADFSFVQISDSHIGFNKPANPDVNGTLNAAVAKINSLEKQPDFILHTGDISHLAKPGEFDTTEQILSGLRQKDVMYVPGEHDVTGDDGKEYFSRFAKKSPGKGWFSFDHKGVHFLGLNNVVQLEGMGKLGADQLEWAKKDLASLSRSTPIVVFAHIPLWSVYPAWNWGTEDSAELLTLLKPFGSITVLNGHIHQTMQKVEGNVTFHTAMSTAFPQPAPGQAPAPGPMKVPEEHLRMALGITEVNFTRGTGRLAVVDSPLDSMESGGAHSADGANDRTAGRK
jgi:3',5'-cyclic-AMP phosphodiesterase